MSDDIKPHVKLQKEFIIEYLKYIAGEELGKNIKPEHLSELMENLSILPWLSKNFDAHFTVLLSEIYEDHQEYFENLK